MTNAQYMSARIRRCKTLADLQRAERSLDRLYEACVFSTGEYRMLDGMIFRRIARLENEQ